MVLLIGLGNIQVKASTYNNAVDYYNNITKVTGKSIYYDEYNGILYNGTRFTTGTGSICYSEIGQTYKLSVVAMDYEIAAVNGQTLTKVHTVAASDGYTYALYKIKWVDLCRLCQLRYPKANLTELYSLTKKTTIKIGSISTPRINGWEKGTARENGSGWYIGTGQVAHTAVQWHAIYPYGGSAEAWKKVGMFEVTKIITAKTPVVYLTNYQVTNASIVRSSSTQKVYNTIYYAGSSGKTKTYYVKTGEYYYVDFRAESTFSTNTFQLGASWLSVFNNGKLLLRSSMRTPNGKNMAKTWQSLDYNSYDNSINIYNIMNQRRYGLNTLSARYELKGNKDEKIHIIYPVAGIYMGGSIDTSGNRTQTSYETVLTSGQVGDYTGNEIIKIINDGKAPEIKVILNNEYKEEEEAQITIKVKDALSGLNSNNVYEYCISDKIDSTDGCIWYKYNNNKEFTLKLKDKENYYIHVRDVADKVGNVTNNRVGTKLNVKKSIRKKSYGVIGTH